ncbi:hypothetical protein PV327_006703 [Microctonus hyperodae]|uniref:Uncharacterized protein n=1 Tax=Microctonus hyperodae TaxID=165561 RepID=A0AA39F4X4_MICHY|nr:hypothetical protein PV327_006703 [Microctonus hyperodae]
MTKILICVLIAFPLIAMIHAGPIPDEFKEVAPGIRETCMKESGAEEAIIEKAATGEFIEDDKFKCYTKCVFDQFRLISKKGFNFEAMLGLSPPKMKDTAVKAIAACRDTSNYLKNSLTFLH